MALLVNSVEVSAPAEVVFDYVSDLTNELEWGQPVRIVKMTEGPVGVGTHFDAEWKGSGRIDVEYIAMEPPRSWATLGHSPKMDVNFAAEVTPLAHDRARITVTMELLPHGAFKLLLPVIKRVMQKAEEKNAAALKAAIERRAAGLGTRSGR